jgi:flagellar basal-body rod modification protein FlgD
MSQVSSTTGGSSTSGTGSANKPRDLRDLDVEHFLQLMIAEMQNQDPMNPMDNAQMMEQINQLREISATDKLTDTLESVLLGQNLATASSLIGKEVKALTDDAKDVQGKIDRVSVETTDDVRKLRVRIGSNSIDLKNIREIIPS